MSVTTHAPKQIDPVRFAACGSRSGWQKAMAGSPAAASSWSAPASATIIDEDPPIGNGRAMSVLFAREGASVACIDVNKEAADDTVGADHGRRRQGLHRRCRRLRRLGDRAQRGALRETSSAGSMGWR